VGHLTKALDYEEAIIAAIAAVFLISTASQYRIRSSNKWMKAGLKTALISFAAVLLFGFVSFYFIDIRYFGVDFTWQQSLLHTFKSFLLVDATELNPVTKFGHEFVWLIRVLGFLTWFFLLFTIVKPHLKEQTVSENYKEKAKFLLSQFGDSAMDYYKLYKDKLYFFSEIHDAFLAYRISNGFAIVLEEPVCAEEYKTDVIAEFDKHCRKMGLKPAFYRVDGNSIPWFSGLRKQKLMIGQEAILEISSFSLEGKDKKSLRNGLSSLQKKGYTVKVHIAPHNEGFLSRLKNVSDDWLENFNKGERTFSQGIFDEKELQQQDIITLNDAAGDIKAFLNVIPDYAEDECTYDLIRKANDAPGAAMDALLIQLIEYAKERKQLYLNLGLVPMTGIEQPGNTAEQIIKLAAEKIKRFQHYKGLREFKEKYATLWENKYLVYDNDFDLLQLPRALNNIMKP
jgi:phosphatidylglycerol lysyltransferase